MDCTLKAHKALKNSEEWKKLKLRGYQPIYECELLELRDCPDCGSTLAVPVKRSALKCCMEGDRMNLPDWLEIVDSYDKATPWPGDDGHGYRLSIFPSGKLAWDNKHTLVKGLQWVRVRSYREGAEAAIATLKQNHFGATPQCLRDLIAPPKPPLKFGDPIETVGRGNGWVNAVFIKIENDRLFAVDEGDDRVETLRYRLSDENLTWRRKS
ncbi:MAG: hypothetical protein NW202_13325 [Nitrospira sp.]|nr:hypothetical protein [Nitrospira sp.]